ncbi:hypothetical protein FO519_007814 [Halicephalobus sp. NKZ332]|nr:hypothetical protein FO519_007814 [Halicephalobus sp. NKZ332]
MISSSRVFYFVVFWILIGNCLGIRNCTEPFASGAKDLNLTIIKDSPVIFVFDLALEKISNNAFIKFYDDISCLLPDDTPVFSVFVGNSTHFRDSDSYRKISFYDQWKEILNEGESGSEPRSPCELFDEAVSTFVSEHKNDVQTFSPKMFVIGEVNPNRNSTNCEAKKIEETISNLNANFKTTDFILNIVNLGMSNHTVVEQSCEELKTTNKVAVGAQVQFKYVGLKNRPDATIRRSKGFVKELDSKSRIHQVCFPDTRKVVTKEPLTQNGKLQNVEKDEKEEISAFSRSEEMKGTSSDYFHVPMDWILYIADGIALLILLIVVFWSIVDKGFWKRRKAHGERKISSSENNTSSTVLMKEMSSEDEILEVFASSEDLRNVVSEEEKNGKEAEEINSPSSIEISEYDLKL